MTTIKCPLCRERVSCGSSDELTSALRVHVVNVHGMQEIAPVIEGSGRSTSDRQKEEGTSEERVEQAAVPKAEEGMGEAITEELTESDITTRQSEKDRREMQVRTSSTEDANTEVVPALVNCPMCGDLVIGRSSEDLSDELRDHMEGRHGVWQRMAAWMNR